MPTKFQRIGEKVKQALGFTSGAGKDWKPTSNARNEAMIKEARRFAQQLKALHKDLTGLDKATEVGLGTVRSVLASPLPRAYDETPVGVVPVDKEERLVGINVNIEGITGAATELKQRLQNEVLHPLEQWLSAYRSIKDRNKRVEQLRLDLDTKRRATLVLQEKLQKLKSKESKDTENTAYKAQTEEDKMHRMAQRFAEAEAEVFNALLTLIRDTAVLREYAAAGLAILQRCYTLAYTTFDLTTPIAMPMLPPAAVPTGYPPVSYGVGSEGGGSAGYGSPPVPLRASTFAPASSRTTVSSGGGAAPAPLASSATFSVTSQPYKAPPSPNAEASSQPQPVPAAAPVAAPLPPPQLPPPMQAVSHPVPTPTPPPAGHPPPPAWYAEAKRNATPHDVYDDSDDEGAKPARTSNPFKSPDPHANPFNRSSGDD